MVCGERSRCMERGRGAWRGVMVMAHGEGSRHMATSWPLSPPFLPQLEGRLSRAEAKQGRKALSESDYVEVLEQSCLQDWEL